MFKYFFLLLITLSMPLLAKTKINYYDRDGDQYDEEKQTIFKKGYYTLKTVVEIDSNKDKKVDREITTFYHHDRMKTYTITRIDTDFDGKWDSKTVKIKPLVELY